MAVTAVTAVTAVSTVEAIKAASNQLRGTIGEELSDAMPGFSPESQHLLKFHGVTAVEPGEAPEEDPLYGTTYLPRRFKIGFAFPGDNCIDVYSNDIGVVPALDGESLRGFTVLVGGGHGQEPHQPRHLPPPRRPPHDGGSRGAVGGVGHHHPRATRPRRPPRP